MKTESLNITAYLAISVIMVTLVTTTVVIIIKGQQTHLHSRNGNKTITEKLRNVEDHTTVTDNVKHKGHTDIYFVSKTNLKALKIVREPGDTFTRCAILTRNDADKDTHVNIIEVSEAVMDEFTGLCVGAMMHPKYNSYDAIVIKKRYISYAVYPGTKWCGVGSIAVDNDDLGELAATDVCCRDHDNCNPSLMQMGYGYGLFNYAIWAKKHCDCDTTFFHCLKNVSTPIADYIGYLYFDRLAIGCFDNTTTYPESTCVSSFWGICYSWDTDYTRPVQEWNFVPNQHTFNVTSATDQAN